MTDETQPPSDSFDRPAEPAAPVPPPAPAPAYASSPTPPAPQPGPAPQYAYAPPPPPPPRKRGRGWMWVGLSILLLGGGGLFLLGQFVRILSGGSVQKPKATVAGRGVDEFPFFTEETSWGTKQGTKVVRISLDGVIMRGTTGGLFSSGEDQVERVLRRIRYATNKKDVKGILFEVNSPGGGVTPSDEIYQELLSFKAADPERKIVVHMRDLAASGGYYVSMAADSIVAEPTTIVGSIGVIMQAMNFSVLADKVGVTSTTIASGENKDLLNPFKAVDPAQVAILQDMVDEMQSRFEEIVATGRGMKAEAVKPIADGRVFSAPKAVEYGLVDEIGYFSEAVAVLAKLMGQENLRIVRLNSPPQSLAEILMSANAPDPVADVQSAWMAGPQFLYLWRP